MKTTSEDKEKMVELYTVNGLDSRQIANIYDMSLSGVCGILKRRGVKLIRTNFKKKYNNVILNESFFENPNTEKSSYYAGFIAADGCIHQGKMKNSQPVLSIEIHNKDIDILEKFDIGTDISFRKTRNMCKKSISSSKMCEDLEKYGIVQNKTFLLTFPSNIDTNNIRHFIRGVFDGDGWFTVTKQGYLRAGIVGCYEFLLDLQKNLPCKSSINVPKDKKYAILNIYHKESEAFGNFIYKDSTLFLDRKRQIFESIFKLQPC
jgi:intein/homing endonuclease